MNRAWLTIYTKPREERKVADLLVGRGIEPYLPIIKKYSKHSRREEASPFFPCYLFARVDISSCIFTELRWTPGLRNIVSFGGKIAFLSDSDITHIQQRLNDLHQPFNPTCDFKHGERVRILDGPLKDLEAVFDRPLSKRQRVRIFMEFLGRITACEIETNWLEKAGQPL